MPENTCRSSNLNQLLHLKCKKQLDQTNHLSLNYWQGFKTLCIGGTTATDNGGFFVPSRLFLIGRGGVRTIQKRFTVKTHAPYLCTVLNTPIAFKSNQFKNSIGGHHHG